MGKTTTKDLLAAVLGTTFATSASVRSFNNELGVPLTLANAPDGTEALVVEMGARGRGHIAELCAMARPTVGVVTSVEAVHTEMFGDVGEVAVAKGELVESLPASGVAVLNVDNPLVAAMADRTDARVVRVARGAHHEGAGPPPDVWAEDVTVDDDLRPSFRLCTNDGERRVTLSVRGEHNVDQRVAGRGRRSGRRRRARRRGRWVWPRRRCRRGGWSCPLPLRARACSTTPTTRDRRRPRPRCAPSPPSRPPATSRCWA